MKRSAPLAFLNTLVFFCGAAALIYEAVWARLLMLALGAGAQSLAVAAAGTMLGLAVGSELGGRLADRRGGGAPMFGVLMLAVAVAAIAATSLLRAGAETFLPWPVLLLAIVLPNAFMGAALPVLAPALANPVADISALYAANTAGAVFGTLAAGFFLIERLGLAATMYAGAAVNVAAGLIATASGGTKTPVRSQEDAPESSAGFFGAAISGFSVMALEVVDARLLVHAFHATTHAIAIILASFIAGLAIGGALCAARLKRSRALVGELGAVFLASAAAVLATAPGLAAAHPDGGSWTWGVRLASEAFAAALLLVPAATIMGFAFPMALASCVRSSRPGGATGRVFLINAVFGALGSLGAAFVLMPAFGLRGTAAAVAVIQGLTGAYLVSREDSWATRRDWGWAICAVLALCGAFWARPPMLGVSPGHGTLVPDHVAGRERDFRVLCYREGNLATTEVVEDLETGFRTLFVDGFVTAGESATSSYMALMGRLPMTLHPEPKRALVICLGGGATARAVAEWPKSEIDLVDVNPDVFDCAPSFGAANRDLLARARSFIEDGRRFLRRHGPRYDVITQEPMPPYFAGTPALYSVEYYRLARQRLADDGILTQWLPLHLVAPRDARQIVAAASTIFPQTYVALAPGGETAIVISSPNPLETARMKLAQDKWKAEFVLDPAGCRRYAAGTDPVVDDRPELEYSGVDRVRDRFSSPNELAAFNIAALRQAAAP